jgi:hypothetical protein
MRIWSTACIAALGVLIQPVATEAQAGGDELLNQAVTLLESGEFSAAADLGRDYVSSYGRRYKADFVVAVGDCMTPPRYSQGLSELQALADQYAMNASSATDITYWSSQCAPPPASSGDGVIAEGLGPLPSRPKAFHSISSSASPVAEPKLLSPMSGLVPNTSYSGDDYHQLTTTSPNMCAAICKVQAPCRSMTYIVSTKACFLKRSVPAAQHGADFISAYKIK